MTKVLIAYYSSYGHTFEMAKAVAEGAAAAGAEAVLRRVPELRVARVAMSRQDSYVKAQEAQKDVPEATLEDLRDADGVAFGTPTRYGDMSEQLKRYLDTIGPLWEEGALADKVAGVFTSTATIHDGQESTILTTLVPLLHLGFVFVGTPCGQNQPIRTGDGMGGPPCGPGTVAGPDGSRHPEEKELETARNLGRRIAQVAAALRSLRASREKGKGRTRAA